MDENVMKKFTDTMLTVARAQNNVADEMKDINANLVKFMALYKEHLKSSVIRPEPQQDTTVPLKEIAAALDRQTEEMCKTESPKAPEEKKIKIAIRHSDGSASLITEE